MNLRAKLLLIFLVGSLAPVLLVSGFFYRNSLATVEKMLREEVESETASIARNVGDALREREAALSRLAQNVALREYVQNGAQPSPVAATNGASAAGGSGSLPDGARAAIGDFISSNEKYCSSLTFIGARQGSVPVRFEPPVTGSTTPRVKTGERLHGQLRLDERVWTTSGHKPLRSNVTRTANGTPGIVYTVPVFSAGSERAPRAALVAELKLDALLQEAGKNLPAATPAASAPRENNAARFARVLLALDASGQIIYHTNDALKYQPVNAAMPYFDALAREMTAGHSGTAFYRVPSDGTRWLASYKSIGDLNLSIAVAGNYTRAVESVRRGAWPVFVIALLIVLTAVVLLQIMVAHTKRRIERVTAAAAAIAAGDLNQRIDARAGDETRALAESFNRMSDRLRELIARETETRQFQSFVRLSAMLTHDLKNAIMGLSILVTNMERQFHRAEFRADAVSSLRQATEKLGQLVTRLSEPVKSLSGEYRRTSQSIDLIPLIKRALATTAEPSASFYEIKTELPDTLIAPVDAERMERVVENLVVNALEAMGAQGGRLTVAAGTESASLVFFSVEDTGVGISEEFIRTRLFRAFATTKQRGIGLGLYTCREVVESHGGRLEVKSELGSGTRFRVVLPSAPILSLHTRSVEKPSREQTEKGADG